MQHNSLMLSNDNQPKSLDVAKKLTKHNQQKSAEIDLSNAKKKEKSMNDKQENGQDFSSSETSSDNNRIRVMIKKTATL